MINTSKINTSKINTSKINLQDILSQLDLKKRDVAIKFYHKEHWLILIFYLRPIDKKWKCNTNSNEEIAEFFSDSNAYFANIKNYESSIRYYACSYNSYDFYEEMGLELGDMRVSEEKTIEIIAMSDKME